VRSNCLFFAFFRWLTRGGYIVVRQSHYGWWPHFLWSPNLIEFEEFEPVREKQNRIFPPLVFRGYIRRCVAVECRLYGKEHPTL
jgi:hypothetical protein